MDLLKIFKLDKDGVRRSHVKNLLSVALADGHLDPDEWDLLVTISKVMGISEEEIHTIKEKPEQVPFIPPKKYEDKVQQIHDLVAVMTVDSYISPRELALCKKISLKLDILPNIVDDIIRDVFNPNSIAGESSC